MDVGPVSSIALPRAAHASRELESLGMSTPKDREGLEATAAKLEGVFVSMLVKTMRESMDGEGGLFGEGTQGDIYGDFFDRMVGDSIAERGGLGIAEMVIRSSLRASADEEARKEG